MSIDFINLLVPADYTPSTIPVVFMSSSPSEMCVMIPLVNDDLFEESEFFSAELFNIQGTTPAAPTSVPVIIEDDDSKLPSRA